MSIVLGIAISPHFYTAVFVGSKELSDISFTTKKITSDFDINAILHPQFLKDLLIKEFDFKGDIKDVKISFVPLDRDLALVADRNLELEIRDPKLITSFDAIMLAFDYDQIAKLGEFIPNELDAIFNIKRYGLEFPHDLLTKIDACKIAQVVNRQGEDPCSYVYSNVLSNKEPDADYLKNLSLDLENLIKNECIVGINFDPFFKYSALAAALDFGGYSSANFFSMNSVKPEFIYMNVDLVKHPKTEILKDGKKITDKFLKSKINFMSLAPETSLTIQTPRFEQNFTGLMGFSFKS